jgi:hypothetical protein
MLFSSSALEFFLEDCAVDAAGMEQEYNTEVRIGTGVERTDVLPF